MFKRKPKIKFNANTLYQGHYNVTYKGITAIKCPFDYVMYQMLIFELKPDLIIEIGTHMGGTALYFSDLLGLIGKGEVHTIDIIKERPDKSLKADPRIKLFTGGYQEYDLSLTHGFDTILVIDDASHTYQDTISAMKKFAPVVTKNSYLIIEDGIITELNMEKDYGGGPLKAINEFLSSADNFIIDRKWCDMFGTNATFNVNGFLKKVR